MNFSLQPHVIIIDENDVPMGICEKIYAHKIGILHRAVSVYLTCGNKAVIQKRSLAKYHGGGLWSGAACTHPLIHETNESAVHRALQVELGLQNISISYKGFVKYRVDVGNFIEHELTHIFSAEVPENIVFAPSPAEVSDVKFVDEKFLTQDFKMNAQNFSPWFPYIFEHIMKEKA